jgi:hypothetical protein
MASRLARILIAALIAGLAVTAVARADGDPASDVLLGQSVFYPYQPPVSADVQRTLNAETAIAKRSGYPIKVALIGSSLDLGVVPSLFDKPQKYADFLFQEIMFMGRHPLLVVMPNGFGTEDVTGKAKLAAASLHRPTGKTSTELARAAIAAVFKLAAAAGHPLKGVPGASGGSGSGGSASSTTPILIGLAATVVVAAGAVLVLRRRQAVGPG